MKHYRLNTYLRYLEKVYAPKTVDCYLDLIDEELKLGCNVYADCQECWCAYFDCLDRNETTWYGRFREWAVAKQKKMYEKLQFGKRFKIT